MRRETFADVVPAIRTYFEIIIGFSSRFSSGLSTYGNLNGRSVKYQYVLSLLRHRSFSVSLLDEYPKRYPIPIFNSQFRLTFIPCLFTAINDVLKLLTFTWAAEGLQDPFNLRH
jgi:hypothetical protein